MDSKSICYNEQIMISVIVPVYKVEHYLDKCVESIIKQTYRNLDIILVNDGSPDECGDICDKWSKIDNRIRVIHKKNGGLSSARNAGLKIARGEYVIFVDSDDWIDKCLCENSILDAIESNADIVVFGYIKIHENRNNQVLGIDCPFYKETINGAEGIKRLIEGKIQNYAWNKMYKRSLFNNVEYPEGRLWEDIGTTYRLFLNSDRIVLTNRVLYNYLIRSGSITNTLSNKALVDIFEQRYKQYNDLLEVMPDIAENCIELLCLSAIEVCDHIGDCIESHNAIEFLEFIKEKIPAANFKIKLFWFNKKIFFKVFSLFNKHRTIFIKINQRIKSIKVSVRKKFHILTIIKKKLRSTAILNLDDINTNRNRYYIIGTPDHDNLGDHAIALASKEFVQNIDPEGEVILVSENTYWNVRLWLKKNIRKNDVIILQGGGNLGNEYMYIEDIRRDAIRTFKNNSKIIFPQTIYFTKDSTGDREKEKTKRLYRNEKKIEIFSRELYSYDLMKEAFGSEKVKIVPDIVLSMPFIENNTMSRKGILLCLRSDHEGKISFRDRQYIKEEIMKITNNIYDTDTCIKTCCDAVMGEKEIQVKLNQFSRAELVVTDRLHGMVFAALTGTPCIALSNYNKKVQGVYDWIKELPYIYYLDDLSNFSIAIKEVLNVKKSGEKILENLSSCYMPLAEAIKRAK